MSLNSQIKSDNIPNHVAIIMDGNGRWAKKQSKLRIFGHRTGVKTVREIVEGSVELGIRYLTLYAFSSENWNRPKFEINALMELLVQTIHSETKTLVKNNVKVLSKPVLSSEKIAKVFFCLDPDGTMVEIVEMLN